MAVNDSLNARLTHVEEESGDMQNYEQAVRLLEDRMKYFRKTGNRGQIAKLRDDQRAVREDQMILMNRMKELENERTAHIEQKRQEQFAHEKRSSWRRQDGSCRSGIFRKMSRNSICN